MDTSQSLWTLAWLVDIIKNLIFRNINFFLYPICCHPVNIITYSDLDIINTEDTQATCYQSCSHHHSTKIHPKKRSSSDKQHWSMWMSHEDVCISIERLSEEHQESFTQSNISQISLHHHVIKSILVSRFTQD